MEPSLKIQLSTKPFDGAIKPAFEIEDGYNLVPFYPLTLTQIIYVLMFKNLDSQTALGKGRTNADSYTNTGTTNKKTFCYGSTDATDNVKFLGMEDYFGNRRWWIDGCYYDNNRNMLIGKGNFNNTGSGYENFGQAASSNLGGYIDKVQGGNNTGLIPASTGGSATTYYCDYGNVYAGRLPTFGGYRSITSNAGAFYLNSDTASYSSAHIGGRLFYSKDSKIYIGAYLGVEQNGKLRSISGYESANNKTIGSFRSLARANKIKAGDNMRVRGTMKEVPEIEVNVDTVYVRANIERIEEEDFVGWEYDETQYNKDEFIELISNKNKQLIQENELNKQAIAELTLLLSTMLGGV